MKLVRFLYRGAPRYGRLREDQVILANGRPDTGFEVTGVSVNADKVELLAPVSPSKIVAVGLNYRDHAAELSMELPDEPILFLKPPSAVVGPGGLIAYPAASKHVEYEAELAVVMKKTAKEISGEQAPAFILGYTCANDITARDLQKLDGQWTRAKSFDTFCPLGPHIETDIDPLSLDIELTVNGQVRQQSNTGRMLRNVFELVGFVSRVMTLLPGDVILTGTPPGVGPISPGDLVEVYIKGIGRLANRVV